jgi:6-hydroxymethylpterin diphosphokinase MptE-like/Glycosyltransferase Maf N-terminal domain
VIGTNRRYCMEMITTLRQLPARDRAGVMGALYKKNRDYFKEKQPLIDRALESVQCPYHFNITESFLDIVHTPSDTIVPGQQAVDQWSIKQAGRAHDGWIEMSNLGTVDDPRLSGLHSMSIQQLHNTLRSYLPNAEQSLDAGQVLLPVEADGRFFSPPVVFFGIFHGLHIDFFLQKNSIPRILLIEPDIERFEVSCYFLDYEEIDNRFSGLPLNLGHELDSGMLHWFHGGDKVTSRLWLRVLPAYSHGSLQETVEKVGLQQRMYNTIVTSLDQELDGIVNGYRNLHRDFYHLLEKPVLPGKLQIAVVASGPSLDDDIEWLEKHQNQLVIFAVHSAVRSLQKYGIRPDFQFSLDMHLTQKTVSALELIADVPFIAISKSTQATFHAMDKVYLVADRDTPNSIQFTQPLVNTQPSTTNLAFSFACFCKPKRIFLLGVDLGFRDARKTFVSGSHHGLKKKTKNLQRREQHGNGSSPPVVKGGVGIVTGNFAERGTVYTSPFYNQVRLSLEQAISNDFTQGRVQNLSDGARIAGAHPCHSSMVEWADQKDKKEAVQGICRLFHPAQQGVTYSEYTWGGEELTKEFVATLGKCLHISSIDRLSAAKAIDGAIAQAIYHCMEKSNCLRMVVYLRMVVDLLTTWYRFLLTCPDNQSFTQSYKLGRESIMKSLGKLKWPEGVDG